MNKYQTALNNISKGGKFIEEHKEDIDTLQELVNYIDKLEAEQVIREFNCYIYLSKRLGDTLQKLANYKYELFDYKTLLSQYQQHFRKACEMLEEKTDTSAIEWERIIESDD